ESRQKTGDQSVPAPAPRLSRVVLIRLIRVIRGACRPQPPPHAGRTPPPGSRHAARPDYHSLLLADLFFIAGNSTTATSPSPSAVSPISRRRGRINDGGIPGTSANPIRSSRVTTTSGGSSCFSPTSELRCVHRMTVRGRVRTE